MALLAATVLLLAGCSNDDDSSSNNFTIYGKWYQKESVINNTVFPYDDHEICGKDYLEFYDENKVKSIDVWDCEEDLDWQGTFTKNGNNLTISNGSENMTVEITELTSESLAFKYNSDVDENGTEEQVIERFTRN